MVVINKKQVLNIVLVFAFVIMFVLSIFMFNNHAVSLNNCNNIFWREYELLHNMKTISMLLSACFTVIRVVLTVNDITELKRKNHTQ